MSTAAHLNQLSRDAHELAQHLRRGEGVDVLDVLYGGAYPEPGEVARLLRAAADVLDGSR